MVDDEVPHLDVHATTQPGRTEAHADAETLVPLGAAAATVMLPAPGYALGDAIGRGGMGEVLAARDLRIDREVAVKRMTAEEPSQEQISRFLREAKIQARLGHPAIVPVHELGIDERGRPYFTMKRLTGKTLAQELAAKPSLERATLNRLLRVFVDVCFAAEFAHANDVVHRDLKPSNIMLGNFGEVYVLDWGIARVTTEDGDVNPDLADIQTLDDGTKSGALIGTPGYMAPEQIRGFKATGAADVYALGSILFEILAGELLHRRGEQGIAMTLSRPQVLPSERKPDRGIPPELDQLCWSALAEQPEERPTARQLAERVQAYLDGDRDLERRRVIAEEQLASARAVLAGGDADRRATAMRRAGRALALDPQSEEAAALVSSLLLEPPRQLPSDLEAGLEEQERTLNRDRSRKAIWAYLSPFLLLPMVAVLDIKSWPSLIAFISLLGLGALSSAYFVRSGKPSVAVVFAINLAIAVMFTRIAGPFVLTPLMVCCALAGVSSIPWINERTWPLVAWSVCAVMAPILLEWTGALRRTWEIGEGRMVVISDMVVSHGRPTELALVGGNLVFTVVIALLAQTIARRRRVDQQQLYVQAWHLRHLLPSAKQPWRTT
ncbi:MAG TPA: serine/threonine-protein kinase [Kofleriaceae bacterium]|nr:serine/threonine-protein kinase [Kofleriaceae bacterium]